MRSIIRVRWRRWPEIAKMASVLGALNGAPKPLAKAMTKTRTNFAEHTFDDEVRSRARVLARERRAG